MKIRRRAAGPPSHSLIHGYSIFICILQSYWRLLILAAAAADILSWTQSKSMKISISFMKNISKYTVD